MNSNISTVVLYLALFNLTYVKISCNSYAQTLNCLSMPIYNINKSALPSSHSCPSFALTYLGSFRDQMGWFSFKGFVFK